MKDSLLYYKVGPLLYCPANNERIADSILSERFGTRYSLALCLEDTIGDDHVSQAEASLVHSIKKIHAASPGHFFIPQIFIRVRSAAQIASLIRCLKDAASLITGFIIPKFSFENADFFIHAVLDISLREGRKFYMMPIFESPTIINLRSRYDILYGLKEKLDQVEEYVLNIRVGGNDLCHYFGFRRHSSESIYGIRPVSDILSNIITVFGADYVISGPVWEYYQGDGWDLGLQNELREDRLCGFVGKTVIHPNQTPLVNEAYAVEQKDYDDALAILNWDSGCASYVSGSAKKERMNEYKTHYNWAKKTVLLAEAYGIK